MGKNIGAKYLLSAVAFLSGFLAFGQEKIWTKQSKLSEAISFEKGIDPNPRFLSQNVELSKDYYPLVDRYPVGNPLTVEREPVGYLPVYAQYFFTPGDSVLRLISYDWEKGEYDNFFDKQKIWAQERTKFNRYNDEYKRIRSILVAQLGTPKATDSVAKENASDGDKYLSRETVWDTENVYASLSMIFQSTTYRVRFTLYWKQ